MLLVSIFQLFWRDPELEHVGMTRSDESETLPTQGELVSLGLPPYLVNMHMANPM
jgi:hypothetical protein